MSRASIARKLVKEAAPHFSVLKVFLDNLRKGRAWDAAGEEAFDLARPSLMRNVRGRKAAVEDVVEAAGFDPGDLSYHGSYGLIDDFRVPKGEMGIHVTGDPLTAIDRGYRKRVGRDEIKDVVGASEYVNSMQDLLRSFYDLGESAPAGKNLAKWFKGSERPFSHWQMGQYDFLNQGKKRVFGERSRRSINPSELGADYNVYPFFQRQGLRTIQMPDVGHWNMPKYVMKRLNDLGQSSNPLRYPEEASALEFYKKYTNELTEAWMKSFDEGAVDQASRLKDIFEKGGIDAIDYVNLVEGTGEELSRLILDPAKNLRAPFAAFKGESGWMAGLLPLISLLRGKREE